jgi:hypothetical protein
MHVQWQDGSECCVLVSSSSADSWGSIWEQLDKHKALAAVAGAYRTAETAATLVLGPGQKLGQDLGIEALLAQAAQAHQPGGDGGTGAGPQPGPSGAAHGVGGVHPGTATAAKAPGGSSTVAGEQGEGEEPEGPPRKRARRGTGRGKSSASPQPPTQPPTLLAGTSSGPFHPPQQPAQPSSGLDHDVAEAVRRAFESAIQPAMLNAGYGAIPQGMLTDTASVDGLASGLLQQQADDAQSEPPGGGSSAAVQQPANTSQGTGAGTGAGEGTAKGEASGSARTSAAESALPPDHTEVFASMVAQLNRPSFVPPLDNSMQSQMEWAAQQAAFMAAQPPLASGPAHGLGVQQLVMGGQDAGVRQDLVSGLALLRGIKHFTLKIASDEVLVGAWLGASSVVCMCPRCCVLWCLLTRAGGSAKQAMTAADVFSGVSDFLQLVRMGHAMSQHRTTLVN